MTTRFYAAWNKDENVLHKSTSGGVFSALAEVMLSRGGIVVGAAYTDGLSIEHIVAHDENGLEKLRGVKYAFSRIDKSVIDEMAEMLGKMLPVMFVGTPCQAAAIRKRFGSDPNLLVCDLVCFGAPPNETWLKYVAWMEEKNGKKLKYISPRDKSKGWGRVTHYRYEWEDGSVTRRCSRYDPYARAFYTTLAFRSACFDCRFRGIDRQSDLTLCDMWNAEALDLPDGVLRNGVSGVMVHSASGEKVFSDVSIERMTVSQEIFIEGNFPILHSPDKPALWQEFAADMKAMPFEVLVRKYRLQQTRLGHSCQLLLRLAKRVLSVILPQRVKAQIKTFIQRG